MCQKTNLSTFKCLISIYCKSSVPHAEIEHKVAKNPTKLGLSAKNGMWSNI
jgi:hypothetical protein